MQGSWLDDRIPTIPRSRCRYTVVKRSTTITTRRYQFHEKNRRLRKRNEKVYPFCPYSQPVPCRNGFRRKTLATIDAGSLKPAHSVLQAVKCNCVRGNSMRRTHSRRHDSLSFAMLRPGPLRCAQRGPGLTPTCRGAVVPDPRAGNERVRQQCRTYALITRERRPDCRLSIPRMFLCGSPSAPHWARPR
jgi:hypothetical protein